MSRYTLNDSAFDPTPLTLYVPTGEESKIDEEQLQSSFRKNRKLMKQMEMELAERKKMSMI